MFFYTLRFSFLLLDYTFNNKNFTENFCINKDNPTLKCNGKCHLKKESIKITENNKPIHSEQKQTTNQTIEIIFFENYLSYQFPLDFCFLNKIINSNYTNLYCDLFTNSSFHPPQNILFIA